MRFTSQTLLDDGGLEREFTLADFTGILWMPPTATPSSPVPLLLLNQPGGFGTRRMYPRLVARARAAAAEGFASVTIELPGTGDRPPLPGAEESRADLRAALAAGEKPSADLIDRLILLLVDQAVPDWQATLDAVLALPEITTRVASRAESSPSASASPRPIRASRPPGSSPEATFLARRWRRRGGSASRSMSFCSGMTRATTVRQPSTCSTFASREKTLVANMGGHTGVPAFAGKDAGRFFVRHLQARAD
ncbi:alpha/beta hydrolase [Microbacterium sp. B19]|uniref:alpha/beta hydrolase n=1 Tax=Microbacterium sp. B19 TaxID=96765 RepID=UPI0003486D09|nr:alpha/beta hydrolase [Microbacterium sp. B19]